MDTDTLTEQSPAKPMGRIRNLVVRRSDDRVIMGLAGGIADRIGISEAYVRAAFVSLALCGGAGIVLYLIGSAIAPTGDEEPADPPTGRQIVGLVVMLLGTMALLRGLNLWFGDTVVWAGTLLAFGGAAMWDKTNLFDADAGGIAPSRTRIVAGALLLLAGIASLSSSISSIESLGPAVTAAALTGAGFMIIFGPWVSSLIRDLGEERRNRIRADERTEVAAHLHDSVLQTLALIQRTEDPKRMVTLARAQERDLRNYLYGSKEADGEFGLRQALERVASDVEGRHDVPVDVVVVGDMPLNERGTALVAAAGEAMTNASKHSGAAKVSVFAEVRDDAAEIFITDQGKGFETDSIPDGRHGIRDSLIARMKRQGGESEITSEPGEGTEVRLTLPRGTND
ncbi:MAG: PspC domain-containing protein [Acidimicrobiia bacterium]|nr:PspC domain-containing protein [Acidimicrobiia bacterium]